MGKKQGELVGSPVLGKGVEETGKRGNKAGKREEAEKQVDDAKMSTRADSPTKKEPLILSNNLRLSLSSDPDHHKSRLVNPVQIPPK